MKLFLNRLCIVAAVAVIALASCPSLWACAGCGCAAKKKGGYEVGLSMYSLRDLFRSGELHVLDYPAYAKKTFGITKIDVWDGGFPEDKKTDPEFYKKLKKRADAVGSEIVLVMTRAVNSEAKDLKAQAAKFNQQVDLAKVLDAKYVRVFLQAPTKTERSESLKRCAAALKPIADYAKSKGRIIVIEPKPKSHSVSGVFLADLAKKMDHPSLRLMPDFGKMLSDDMYGGTKAMMPYTDVVSAKMHNISPEGETEDFDYPRLMKIVTDAGFKGVVCIEYEGQTPGQVEGVKATQKILEKLNR